MEREREREREREQGVTGGQQRGGEWTEYMGLSNGVSAPDERVEISLKQASASASSSAGSSSLTSDIVNGVVAYALVLLWICMSSTVILFNKYILSSYGFPFPVALTMCHMLFCSVAAMLMIHVFKFTKPIESMTLPVYAKTILPVGALYAVVLWLGNGAYLYLSVSFLQMVKAFMPVLVFAVGVFMKTERVTAPNILILLVVTVGIFVATFNEMDFHLVGYLMQVASMVCEAFRLQLIQILLQGKKMNPIQTLFYVSPACLLFLSIPFVLVEAGQLMYGHHWRLEGHVLLLNCSAALGLNVAVFLLIGKTSALAMNIAGVVKDWTLICLSFKLFSSPIVAAQIEGYFIAFTGVMGYNYYKIKQNHAAREAPVAEDAGAAAMKANGHNGSIHNDDDNDDHDEEAALLMETTPSKMKPLPSQPARVRTH